MIEIKVKGTNRTDNREMVTVVINQNRPTEQKNFHCVRCGKPMFTYYHELLILVFDEVVEEKRPIDIFCNRCGFCHRVV